MLYVTRPLKLGEPLHLQGISLRAQTDPDIALLSLLFVFLDYSTYTRSFKEAWCMIQQ